METRDKEYKGERWCLISIFYFLILASLLLISSCGYHMVGSRSLPFDSITIKPVQNRTYEPGLEERLHYALSKEFIAQGIKVLAAGGDLDLEATITSFHLRTIAAVDERVKEQAIVMMADIRVIDDGRVTEFKRMGSPIKITFQSTGTVSETVAEKERAIEKACTEIAKEIVGRIIVKYAK